MNRSHKVRATGQQLAREKEAIPMPRYPYKPLPRQYIRILELHPGPRDAPLVCNIVTQQIDSNPYDALSYVWGDLTLVVVVKCIDETDEGELGIGNGLAKALIAFRLPKQTRCIWIDALCLYLDRYRTKCRRNLRFRLLFSEGFRFTHLGYSDREIYPYIAFYLHLVMPPSRRLTCSLSRSMYPCFEPQAKFTEGCVQCCKLSGSPFLI